MLDAQEANKEGRRETGEGGVGGLVGRFFPCFPVGTQLSTSFRHSVELSAWLHAQG